MNGNNSFPIEDFLEAITAQLDKTQDALRLKSVNRPLTFGLKDFSIDLQVYVEMDHKGQILFRPTGPNETTGASTVRVGFTTITRPMIEENTISMEMTRSPTLEESGLAPEEQKKLERLGVRNTAQLRKLESEAGDRTLSRLSGVNMNRLKEALQMGKPNIERVAPEPSDANEEPVSRSDRYGKFPPAGRLQIRPEKTPGPEPPKAKNPIRRITMAPDVKRIRLSGDNLVSGGQPPFALLNRHPVSIQRATDTEVTLDLPERAATGLLEVQLSDGSVELFELVTQDQSPGRDGQDPWMPGKSNTFKGAY